MQLGLHSPIMDYSPLTLIDMRIYSTHFLMIVLSLFITKGYSANHIDAPQAEDKFLGSWSMDIDGSAVGWLELHTEGGFLDGSIMWIGGSVTPLSHAYLLDDDQLILTKTETITRADKDAPHQRQHTITHTMSVRKMNDDMIVGTMTAPRREGHGQIVRTFVGRRTPPLPPKPDLSSIRYGTAIKLFNGKDLQGWRMIDPSKPNGFKVEDGILITDPVQPSDGSHIYYGNLRTDREFEDFNLQLEVNIPRENNSGVYLRGMYEVQIYDSYGKPLGNQNMGALYSRITPSVNAEKPHDIWQSLDITLCDRHVTVILNGIKIIDNEPVKGPTGGAIISDVNAPGPIYLQGDHGNVKYRNIVLRPIVK